MISKGREHAKTGLKKRSTKILFSIAALLFVFSLGEGLGSGRIALGTQSTSKASTLPANLNYSSVERIYDLLRKNYDGTLDQAKLLDGLKKGLVEASGDTYTEYFTKEQAQEFNDDLNGTFSGIGAELSKEGDSIIVVSPISGFPADKAGLKSKDVIIEINGENAFGLSVSEAVKQIRGEKGTQVKLRVLRGGSQDISFEITRAEISIPSVETKTLDGNIGYMKISRFADDTTNLAKQAATEFRKNNVKGIIVDVRGNPGGLLDAAVNVSSLWLPSQKTVLQEKRDGQVIKTHYSSGEAALKDIPTIVLVDGGSASASEILAGALKDNKAATLLGQKTYGKGSVQTVEDLPDGSALKVTIARWYTPSGRNIDKEGIEPDTKVDQPENATTDNDPQLRAARQALAK